jgi:hypothetical protein
MKLFEISRVDKNNQKLVTLYFDENINNDPAKLSRYTP